MKTVLVVGGGGREHAIVWKLSKSPLVFKIYCAPGNGGIASIAECVNIGTGDFTALADFAVSHNIDLTVVGMDEPLVNGIVDEFIKRGLRIFGPTASAARIEGSKSFSKALMVKYGIPTAGYEVFSDYASAISYVKNMPLPVVIKADGLAAGKGVLICRKYEDAELALTEMLIEGRFKDSGKTVVIEEYLDGQEVSVLAFCDGKTIIPMPGAKDHKTVFENNEGANTGGMGSVSPGRQYTKEIEEECLRTVIKPTLHALTAEGIEFKGIIFFGLIMTDDGVKVIEYNARFGDPETQVVLPRLETDLFEIFEACVDGRLAEVSIKWRDCGACCVILASGGYPEKYVTGYEINGLDSAGSIQNNTKCCEETLVFHAGTINNSGKYITNGGRVLGVTAIADDLDSAVLSAYEAVFKIGFKDMHYRKDIGRV